MIDFSAKEKRQLAKNIRTLKARTFPGKGSGKELAAQLGVSPQLLSNWINGSRIPSFAHLGKLARIFDVSVQELCSLPRTKHWLSAWEIILDLTKLRECLRKKKVNLRRMRKRLEELNSLVYNVLRK